MSSRTEVIIGALMWLAPFAYIAAGGPTGHAQPVKPVPPPTAAEKRVADLRGQSDSIMDRAIAQHLDNAAFERAIDESGKLDAEADKIEEAENSRQADAVIAEIEAAK